ncbi:nicotinamidase/pyrazinamidase [Legionella steigerwaltii]|uniref:Nicotinamidase/pyrazinamidase n=2 Tax=Legionella steigerwaltii TaxID=460 RepID=A0A378L3Z1_9GAMM|nr:nicotinamidase/pyrazinamidase [Legionella steigerwaltii]STY21506.1 nicotinamidase/pyrazinamidase [Legionella steigerwaltii]
MSDELRLAAHLQAQELFRQNIPSRFHEINQQYAKSEPKLKEELKKIVLKKLNKTKKLALILVDIQNDFVLQGFALYAPGGENTLFRNMALLDALVELITNHPELCRQIEIITTQDAHVFQRAPDNLDAQIMMQSYGKIHTQKSLNIEHNELQQFNPEKGQYGLHCLNGTIGAAISQPIEERLKSLEEKIPIYRFAKINFSAPEAGMKLKKGIDLSNPRFFNAAHHIYDEPALSFLNFFQNQAYSELMITGICGNICVQQAAEGLVKAGERVCVLDPCVHYLIIPGMNSYNEVWTTVQHAYSAKGINLIELDQFRSNPE